MTAISIVPGVHHGGVSHRSKQITEHNRKTPNHRTRLIQSFLLDPVYMSQPALARIRKGGEGHACMRREAMYGINVRHVKGP